MSFFSWLCVSGMTMSEPARLEVAAPLRLQDHLLRRSILHGLARVHELGLAQDGAAGRLRRAPELDQRRVADCFRNSVADGHGHSWSGW
jgi:hypothetical protein